MPKWTSEQLEAIEKSGTNIIVSAGAGSGKTAVLSERVLFKLKHGVHIDELLILTFTRAAADEMRDRIRRKIAEDETLKRELDALESSYITTFDSFALSVVKKYHYLLNLPEDVGVADETMIELEKKRILDEVFDKFYENNDDEFKKLIRRFSLKNDTTIKGAIFKLAEKISGYMYRDRYLDYLEKEFYKKENIEKLIEEFKKLVEEKKKIVSLELDRCRVLFDGDYVTSLETIVLPIVDSKTLVELASHKAYKLPNLKKGATDEEKAQKKELKDALDDLFVLTEFGDEEAIKNSILSTESTTLTIVKILKEYFTRLDNYKDENRIYSFSDIEALAIKVIRKNEPARLELKNKFKEIMIDEYQDTNDVQEELIGLFANDNVYMVGDIKQSIYRFRGSNPSIFQSKYNSYSHDVNGYKIDLIKNFRSRKEVLENINRLFDLLMDNRLGGADYTVSHEMVYGNMSYEEERQSDYNYNLEVLEYEKDETKEFSEDEIEAFAIAKDIILKKKNKFRVFDKKTGKMRFFEYSDAVIILDRSKYFDEYKRIFEFFNIPLEVLKDGKLTTSADIYIIKNAIDLLIRLHERDFGIEFKYDFLSLGRSFLYEIDDRELFEIVTKGNYQNTKICEDFSSIENYDSKTTRELVEDILDVTGFYGKLYKVGNVEDIDIRTNKILDLASSLGNLGYTIDKFRDYLSEVLEEGMEIKYTNGSSAQNAVKILTIHKSKGLEFPICYFADLTHFFNMSELKEKFISDPKYGIITPVEIEGENDSDTVLKILYKEKFKEEEISEKIRLFYVALTRAREKMIIVIPKRETKKLEKNDRGAIELERRLRFKSLGDFVYGIKDHNIDYFKEVLLSGLELTKEYLYTKKVQKDKIEEAYDDFEVDELNFDIEKIEEKHFSKDLPKLHTKEELALMDFGTKVHEVLEDVDYDNPSKIQIKDPFIAKKIDSFLHSKIMEKYRSAKVYREYEFIYEKAGSEYHGIIDLMLEYQDYIDIVDYKLKNVSDEHYIDQLKGYKEYIELVTNKPVNLYLYSIIEGSIVPVC